MFKPSNWLAKIESINRLIVDNSIMAVLASQTGGKTSFINLLQDELDPAFRFLLLPNSCQTVDEISAHLSKSYLQADSEFSFKFLLEQINNLSQHLIVIVDDAETLKIEVIQELLQNLSNQANYLHFCLIGNYSLNDSLLSLPENLTRKIHSLTLGPLTAAELKTYVLKKLPTTQAFKATKENLDRFYKETKGSVSAINSSIDYFFSTAVIADPFVNTVEKICLGTCFFLVVFASLYIWQNYHYLPYMSISKKTPIKLIKPSNVLVKNSFVSFIAPFTMNAIKEPVQPAPLKQIFVIEGSEEVFENMALIDSVITMPKILPKKTDEPEVLISSLQSIPLLIPKKSNKRFYTVQLLASNNQAVINKFCKINKLKSKNVKSEKVKRNGKDWYVLTIGSFEDKQQAQDFLAELPSNLLKNKPWVRVG